jgi:hypothetical protein
MRYNEEGGNAGMLISFQCVFKLASTLPIRWLAKVASALDRGYAFPSGLCIRRLVESSVPALIIQAQFALSSGLSERRDETIRGECAGAQVNKFMRYQRFFVDPCGSFW